MNYDQDLLAGKLRNWETYLRSYTLPAWDELPDLDLYMDQVIALLTQYLGLLPHDEKGEKVITSSAINNYVRMKVMPAPSKKKYSKAHLAYLIMICTLKQSLSISYVQKMIPMGLSEEEVKEIYTAYVLTHRSASLYFVEQVQSAAADILAGHAADNMVNQLISSTAVTAGLYKLLTEKLVALQGVGKETPLDLPVHPQNKKKASDKKEDTVSKKKS